MAILPGWLRAGAVEDLRKRCRDAERACGDLRRENERLRIAVEKSYAFLLKDVLEGITAPPRAEMMGILRAALMNEETKGTDAHE